MYPLNLAAWDPSYVMCFVRRNPNEQDGEATPLFQHMMTLSTRDLDEDPKHQKTEVYEKHNPLLRTRGHGRG